LQKPIFAKTDFCENQFLRKKPIFAKMLTFAKTSKIFAKALIFAKGQVF
jgi:hypothetical protein